VNSTVQRLVIALTLLFVLGAPSAIGAQESDDPAPAATPTPPPVRNTVAKPISLSLLPAITLNTGSDVNPIQSAKAPFAVTALGFRFGYDVTSRLTVYWNRGTPISLNGRYYNTAGVPVYGNLADDISDSYGLSYSATKALSIDAGYARRWRINFPAAGDPTNANPSFYSGAYLGSSWRWGPNTKVGRLFTLYATATDVAHALNPAARAALPGGGAGFNTPGWQIICTSCGFSVRFPVFNQTFFIPRANYIYSANYSASTVYPPYGNSLEYGADFVPTKFVTLTVTVRNFNGHEIGFPYPVPQNQHYSYVSIVANIRARLALPK
jgi:hypothetical protein